MYGTVPPPCDHMKRMSGQRRDRAVGQQTHNRSRRIEYKLHTAILSIRKNSLRAARRAVGVAKHNRLPPVQFLHQRSECGIAEVFASVARKHARAVRLERIKGVFEFEKGAFHIRQAAKWRTGRSGRDNP